MRRDSGRTIFFLLMIIALWTLAIGSVAGEEVLRETLKNGLRVVVVRNTLAPVVTTEINYLVGSNQSPSGFPGMAHAQEHMMFRGSPGLSASQLAGLIAAMGGKFDADTQQTVTQYFFTVPAEDLETALHIEAIRMEGVLDSEKLWSQERGAIEQEVAQDLSNPIYIFYKQLLAAMFAETPYAYSPLGTLPSFQKTTGSMLKEFHEKWYAPNNAIMVIVGNVDPAETLKTVKSLFEGIPSKPLPARPNVHLQPLKATKIDIKSDLPYGLAMVAYRLPGYQDPDYAAGEILSDVLGSQRGKLYALVPEGKALMSQFENSILPEAGLGYAMVAFPYGGEGSLLISRVKRIIAEWVREGFKADLIEAAKRLEITAGESQKNSISGLASEWSQAIAVKGLHSPEEGIKAFKQVSVEDVNRVARKYLVNNTAVVGVLKPEAAGKPIASNWSRGRENFAPKQVERVPLPSWAKKATELPQKPASSISPTDITLSNGLRLIVQQETISSTVLVYGKVKNQPDMETPKGQEGVADVLEALFPYGTTTLDRLALQKALDDIGAEISVGSSFSLEVLDRYFHRGVELLADNLLHPALPESAFKVVQKETIATVKGKLKSPTYLFRRALHKDLFSEEDPTLRQTTPESVASLKLDDVKQYYQRVFRPDLTTIVVIGNIDPQEAKKSIEEYFGQWMSVGPKLDTELPSVPPNKEAATSVPDTTRVQDMVILAQTLGLTRSNPEYYALQVGNHVLSGAFYATRLYRELRENRGLVYMVESALNVGRTRGIFEVVYACDPPNVSRAREIIQRNLREIQSSPVSQEELRQAKIILLRDIPLSESSMDGIADNLLYNSLEGLPLDEALHAGKYYLETTAEQVKAAFAKWIRPNDLVQVTLGPPPH